jgi:hypothetical protein
MRERMLRSVERAAAARPDLTIVVLLLLQRCPEYLYWTISKTLPPFVHAIPTTDALSLSAARNVLLARASLTGLIDAETVLGFPDDDCWYPDGTLDYVTRLFEQHPRLDLWFGRYASNPVTVSGLTAALREAAPRDVARHASSNTIFVRGRVLTADGFDETLGVGTPNVGGEDTEFALRAHLSSRESFYLPAPVIGHRDKTPELRPKYYRGGLIALARHAGREPRIGLEFARKLAVGIWLVLTLQLRPGGFLKAVVAAARSRRPAAAGLAAAE